MALILRVQRVHGISSKSEVHISVAVVAIMLLVVQLCALVVGVKHQNWLVVVMAHLFGVPLLLLAEVVGSSPGHMNLLFWCIWLQSGSEPDRL